MKKRTQQLPTLETYDTDDTNFEEVLTEMRQAKTVMTFYCMPDGSNHFLFTGFGVNEFSMLMHLFDTRPQVFDFFKAAVVNTQLYRIDEERALKYTSTVLKQL